MAHAAPPMKTAPFFYVPPAAETAGRPPQPERLPYHDNTDCPAGQQVRQSGHWQPYEPTRMSETRLRCPVCLTLD